VLCCEEAFSEVAADDLFRVADGGKVGAGIPLEEEIEVGGKLTDEDGLGWEIGFQEFFYRGFGECRHQ